MTTDWSSVTDLEMLREASVAQTRAWQRMRELPAHLLRDRTGEDVAAWAVGIGVVELRQGLRHQGALR
jgi:hypothetical protein